MSSRNHKALLMAATLLLAVGPAWAQESCGKLYENQDCGPAAYEAALARQREAAAAKTPPPPPVPPQPEPGGPASEADLRQRALDLYRARAAAMNGAFQCCHPGVDGSMWCH